MRKIFSAFSLVIISIFVAILLTEIGLRSLKWQQNNSYKILPDSDVKDFPKNDAYINESSYVEKTYHFALMRFSSFLGYYPIKNHTAKGYVTNNHGFRYQESFQAKKPASEIRIFFTGGSTAWGSGVSQEYLYTTLIESELQKYLKMKVRVISAGVGAYLSTHERILILNKIRDFNPDIVVMFSGWNDSYAGYRGKRVSDDTWDYLRAAPILAKYCNKFALDEHNNNPIDPPQYDDFAFKSYYIINRFIYKLKSINEIEKSLSKNQIKPKIVLNDLEDNIKSVFDFSKRYNFSFIFYLQPSLYNTQKKLSEFESYLFDKGKKKYVGFPEYNKKIYDLFRNRLPFLAKQEKFIFLDADKAISREKKTVFIDHVHFGDRGNQLFAKELVDIFFKMLIEKIKSN